MTAREAWRRSCAWCGHPLEPGEGPELVIVERDGSEHTVTSHGICSVCEELIDQELEDEELEP